ncbi:MAG: PrsW family glutamic-type intramembrane protease [Candidatus Paceibacterota bacterium]|nr:MAG: PrsW family glutamic-type intramembrane protease [Candidatus Paceibacterota bacterium]
MHPALEAFLLVSLGLLPSLLWLAFFLRNDCHPEPKDLIARAFLMGIIISPLALAVQWVLFSFGQSLYGVGLSLTDPRFLFLSAFAEEAIKLGAVWFAILQLPEFDEPVDGMIYLITAAMGFAAMENILVMFRAAESGAGLALGTHLWFLRFAGATLLHGLASALAGYFLALAWFFSRHRTWLILTGLAAATGFHFVFNVLIAQQTGGTLFPLTGLLIFLAFLVAILFVKIRERRQRTHVQLA